MTAPAPKPDAAARVAAAFLPAVAAWRAANGNLRGAMHEEEIAEVFRSIWPVIAKEFPARAAAAKPSATAPLLSDDDWIEGLARSDAYAGLSVRQEIAKCAEWCKVNKQPCSRRRIINWLNRVVPVKLNGARASATVVPPEPPRWRERLDEAGFDHIMRDDPRPWAALMPTTRDTILRAIQP